MLRSAIFTTIFMLISCQLSSRKKKSADAPPSPSASNVRAEEASAKTHASIAKQVQDASQQYLDARKQADPERVFENENVARAMDEIAQTIVAAPGNEIAETLKDPNFMEGVTVGVMSEQAQALHGEAPPWARNLAITGGIAILVGAVLGVVSAKMLGSEINKTLEHPLTRGERWKVIQNGIPKQYYANKNSESKVTVAPTLFNNHEEKTKFAESLNQLRNHPESKQRAGAVAGLMVVVGGAMVLTFSGMAGGLSLDEATKPPLVVYLEKMAELEEQNVRLIVQNLKSEAATSNAPPLKR